MRLLVVDNALDHGLYRPVEHWTALAGFCPAHVHPPGGDALPEPGAHTHVILSGSEASIVERAPWAEEELGWLARVVRAGARVLGSCWGHQLVAAALGGPDCVRRSATPELGWARVVPSAGARDPLLDGAFDAFVSHFDEVVPGCHPELRVLASSTGCAVQMLRWGELPVWGIQAHPEIDPATGQRFLARGVERWPEHAARFRAALLSPVRDSGQGRALLARFLAA